MLKILPKKIFLFTEMGAGNRATKMFPINFNMVLLLLLPVLGLVTTCIPVLAQFSEADTFPVPPQEEKMMFYLQRTTNSNTIVYELNDDAQNRLKEDEPIHVYWIRYTEPGNPKKELNRLQRRAAYGIKTTKTGKEEWALKMVAYDKLPLVLRKGKDKRFHVYAPVNGQEVIFRKAYLKIDGGTAKAPNVVYLGLYGTDEETGEHVYQRIQP